MRVLNRTSSASGKFVLRVSPELHQKLKDAARSRSTSLNSICLNILESSANFRSHSANWVTKLQAILERHFHHDFLGLLLFGSEARGERTESSDLDLLIVLSPEFEITRQLYRDWEKFVKDEVEIHELNVSPHFVRIPESTHDAGSLWLEVAIDGRVLFSRDHRIERILRSLRRQMAEGKIRRHLSHGHPYWEKLNYEK